jgi:hypothetical protein
VFRRVDLEPPVDITLSPDVVVDTRMATTIGRDDVRIATIEQMTRSLRSLMAGESIVFETGHAAHIAWLDAPPEAALRATVHSDYGQLESEGGRYLAGKYGE